MSDFAVLQHSASSISQRMIIDRASLNSRLGEGHKIDKVDTPHPPPSDAAFVIFRRRQELRCHYEHSRTFDARPSTWLSPRG